MLTCHGCYIYGRIKEHGGEGLNSLYGGMQKGEQRKVKVRSFHGGVDPSTILSNLAYLSLGLV